MTGHGGLLARLEAQGGLDGLEDGLRLHDHTAATPVGHVVSCVVLVVGMIADVVDSHRDASVLLCPQENATAKVGLEHLWQEGEDVKVHERILA